MSENWRTKVPCENCPFNRSGAGLHLRRSLGRSRWREILSSLLNQEHFYCHKTVEYDDDGEFCRGHAELICAGSIEWQEKHGVSSQLVRIIERIGAMRKKGA